MTRAISIAVLIASMLLGLSLPAFATDRPITVRVKNPDRLGADGVLLSGDWTLVLEFEVTDAVGIVDDAQQASRANMALIIEDPDECIHMQFWATPTEPLFPIEGSTCIQDEVFVRFTPDPLDTIGIMEFSGLDGVTELQDALQDDPFDSLNLANLNKQYFENGFDPSTPPSSFVGVETDTFDVSLDGYGYGANDDFPGLFVWADIGTGIVADEFLNRVADPISGANKLRNMAGLFNSISYTQLAKLNRTSIVAVMNVSRGILEPIVQIDFKAVDEDGAANGGFLRRIDDGAVEDFTFTNPTVPHFQTDAFEEVFATLEQYEVVVRAAVVDGNAGGFIEDRDGNGKYTRADLELMGYTLLSNVKRYKVRAIQFEALDTGPFECPNGRVFKEARLNAEADNGVGCSTGSARSVVRRPR